MASEISKDEEQSEESSEEEQQSEQQSSESSSPVAVISALLFAVTKPVSVDNLARAARLDVVTVETVLDQLREQFTDTEHGFSLVEVAGGWQFRTGEQFHNAIKRLLPPRQKKLSRAAAETLAIVAYRQPVDRAEVESIRGVDALPTIRTLLDGKLIRIIGRQDSPGQPALYGTTPTFLEKFGLRDLADLPTPREMEELIEEPGEVGGEVDGEVDGEALEFEPEEPLQEMSESQ